ncbi:uncharacterized protein LOC135327409 [Dromaius novaehollandiae]|uniref:uncharacterized protein LOC135327409 n=1 Tax=Dromaius novaehollandiae TaxID=8790 RepID=UPI00311FF392
MPAAGGRMRPCRALPLLLLLLAGATTPEPRTASTAEAVSAALVLLDAEATSPDAPRQPGWVSGEPGARGRGDGRPEADSVAEETTCRTGGGGGCGTRRLRVLQRCRGLVFLRQPGQQPAAELVCQTVPRAPPRPRRSRLRDFFGKIKKGIKKGVEGVKSFVERGKLWVRGKLKRHRGRARATPSPSPSPSPSLSPAPGQLHTPQ